MATPYFRFKQFTVWHDRCAMKVGTDGVLLGAIAPIYNKSNVLDVGTGSGLIALMLAQRNSTAEITAIELDADAAQQARENFDKSPWATRLTLHNLNFKYFNHPDKFDLIVSNPPYFVNSLLSPSIAKNAARHTEGLSFTDLLSGVARLLTDEGIACFILPIEAKDNFTAIAQSLKLNLTRCIQIQTNLGGKIRRVILEFQFKESDLVEEDLLIEIERHKYSSAYIELTKEFYLNM
ncbi:tRNA1(Val) (adenine(37)-N6)-methyltransferase [Bacteroides propionicifaciens]|uniref:tRNA1(Val) (adenine(37)-N6)-methyltransferase n=1 Tax=Bacteroides propionicifaciens TaxID=392838 RepID=UPI00036488E8|nr:methyltransferase [Bacteroides propionicifaciens]